MEKDTVSMYFVAAAVARLSAVARDRLLNAAGIPHELLCVPHARVTAESFAALWLAVARELDDEFFGLDSRRMKVGSFALLCHAVMNSQNLDRAVKQLLRGMALFLDDVSAELRLEDQEAVISITNRISDAPARRSADETFLVMVHGLMCWLAGKRIPLLLAEFAYPKPPYAQEYTVMYSQQMRFGAQCTAVRFDARLLSAPVVQTPATLKQSRCGTAGERLCPLSVVAPRPPAGAEAAGCQRRPASEKSRSAPGIGRCVLRGVDQ